MVNKQTVFELGVGCTLVSIGGLLMPHGSVGWHLAMVGGSVTGLSVLSAWRFYQPQRVKAYEPKLGVAKPYSGMRQRANHS